MNPPNSTNNAATHSLLERCGPLSDAVLTAENFLKANVFFSALFPTLFTIVYAKISGREINAEGMSVVIGMGVLGALFSFPMVKGLLLLLREASEKPALALFLRAFRSDAESDKLRAWLKAGLGSQVKLSGIRPPLERSSPMVTFMSPLMKGLRYVGSRQFEMEAPDHNWMARLLATFARTRFVFIDIRDLTPHVLDEVSLAWHVFGPARIVFIVDERQAREAWGKQIGEMLSFGETQRPALHLLEWPSNNQPLPGTIVSSLEAIMKRIPQGVAQVSQHSLEYVRSRTKPQDWDIQLFERPWVLIISSLLVVGTCQILLAILIPELQTVMTFGMSAVFYILFAMAWLRARRQRSFAVQINPVGPPSASRLGWSAALVFSPLLLVGVLMTLAIPAMRAVEEQAAQMQAVNNARQVLMAMRMYANDNNGMYPDSGPRPEGPAETANQAFRELFRSGILTDERIFGCKQSPSKPDQNIGVGPDYVNALLPGENHWALVRGLTDYSSAKMPLILEDPASTNGSPRWNRDANGAPLPGRAWANGKIVVGFVDGSVELLPLQQGRGEVPLRPRGDGQDFFLPHELEAGILDVEE